MAEVCETIKRAKVKKLSRGAEVEKRERHY